MIIFIAVIRRVTTRHQTRDLKEGITDGYKTLEKIVIGHIFIQRERGLGKTLTKVGQGGKE